MAKKSHKGIATVAKEGYSEIKKFLSLIKRIGYAEVSKEEIIRFLTKSGVQIPDRATFENSVQRQFRYISPTGYIGYIHSGIIGKEFSEKGSSWVIIFNQEGKKVLTREFYRTTAAGLMPRLAAYAHFAKNICDGKPQNAELVLEGETEYFWVFKNPKKEKILFHEINYLDDMEGSQQTFILQHESARTKYLKRTFGKVRREKDIRSTWKRK